MNFKIIAIALLGLGVAGCQTTTTYTAPSTAQYTHKIFGGDNTLKSTSKPTLVSTKNFFSDGDIVARIQAIRTSHGIHLEVLGSYDHGLGEEIERLKNRYKINNAYLWSGGGLVTEGIESSISMRYDAVRTHVLNGTYCASSCTLTFIGGTNRKIHGDATIRVHAPFVFNVDGSITCESRYSPVGKYWEEFSSFMIGNYAGKRFTDATFSRCSLDNLVEFDARDTWLQQPNYNASVTPKNIVDVKSFIKSSEGLR